MEFSFFVERFLKKIYENSLMIGKYLRDVWTSIEGQNGKFLFKRRQVASIGPNVCLSVGLSVEIFFQNQNNQQAGLSWGSVQAKTVRLPSWIE